MAEAEDGSTFDFTLTPPLRLPPMLRDTLAVMVLSFEPSIRAPGFSRDLYDAVLDGRVDDARRIVRAFGTVAIAPHANAGAVHVIGHALDSAFKLVEGYAAAFAEWEAGAAARAAAARGEDAEHWARVERLLGFIAPPGKARPRKRRTEKPAAEVLVPAVATTGVSRKGAGAQDGSDVSRVGDTVRGARRRAAR